MIPIMLIDDHPLAINGIGAWLTGTGRFTISGTAENITEAVSLVENMDVLPEIIILDISLGEEDGLDFIPKLQEICKKKNAALAVHPASVEYDASAVPMPNILICSMYEDPFLIQQAFNMGAKAFISKSAKSSEIITAIDALLEGGTYINPRYKLENLNQAMYVLSRRENEIVALVKRNFNNRQIAKRLCISIRTVENHITRIYIKTDAKSREELINL